MSCSFEKPGWAEIHYCVWNYDIAGVQRLLNDGVDVNTKTALRPYYTPLHLAAIDGHLEMVRLLIDRGADIDAEDYGRTTPLKCACGYGYVAIGELLCLNGASVNGRSMQTNSSALFCAARTRKRQLVELLAVLGADVDAAFHVGYGDELTPLAAVAHRRTLSRLLVHLNAELPAEPESLFCSWADKEMVSRFVNLCNEQSKRSEKERLELRSKTLQQIRAQLPVRFMRCMQPAIIGICIALSPLELPPYVVLWIIDWLPHYDQLSHHKTIQLIESVRASIWKIKKVTLE